MPTAATSSGQAARSAGVTRAATMSMRRSAMSAPATGFGGRRPPPARCSGSGAERWGFEGGRSVPLPGRNVQHCVGWLNHLKGARQPAGKRAGRPPATGISGRRNLHTVHGEVRPERCQQPESRPFPKGSSAVPDADRSLATAPPPPAQSPDESLVGEGHRATRDRAIPCYRGVGSPTVVAASRAAFETQKVRPTTRVSLASGSYRRTRG